MPTIPPPAATIQDALNFEDILEGLFIGLLQADVFLTANSVGVISSRSLAIKDSPRVEVNADTASNLEWVSFMIQGNPQRQVPNGWSGDVTLRVVTTRNVDVALPAPLHGVICGRCRFIASAAANLLSRQATYPYLQILELLPASSVQQVLDSKDTDSTLLNFRLKVALNDFTWPIVTIPPANVSVVHPAAAVFSPEIFLPALAPVTYQWQASTNNGVSWANTTDGANYTGSTTASLTVTPTSTGESGNQFRLIIACAAYSSTVTSASATLTVT